MIDALLSFVASKLGDFAVGKAQSYLEIRDDIVWLNGELSIMQAFLRGAEKRSERDEAVAEWLEQVRNIAFRIEDFLDCYTYIANLFKSHGDPISTRPSFPFSCKDLVTTSLRRVTESIIDPSKTTDEIASIKKEVESISRRAQTYGLHGTRDEGEKSSTSSSSSRITQKRFGYSPVVEEIEMVGFDEDVKKLMDWLLSEHDNIPWSFMFVMGMGGSGKTALARRAYKLVHKYFDHHLWLSASDYSLAQDFETAIRRFFKRSRSKNLQHRRYVLVLDDIKDISFCTNITRWFDRHCKGRIILTSRQNIIAVLPVENYRVHILKPLPYELARDLFFKRAFRSSYPHGICPDHLNYLATEIVRKCSGLPLALVLMGGLMSTKETSPREWKEVLDRFNQELLYNPRLKGINCIFQASYSYLPSHLQYCFLYSCLFPQGSEIKRKKIIRMWVAQGFVQEEQGKTLEEVANDYFIQLIERRMLEPIISNFTGELLSYRVHDIVYDMAVSKFKEEFGIFQEAKCSQIFKTRYLAIHKGPLVSDKERMKARAVLAFGSSRSLEALRNFIFLRVLCVDGFRVSALPDQVGDLCHLTYLGLRNTKIRHLPDSLGKLRNLETLDVRDTLVKTLPDNVKLMSSLRHLLLSKVKIHSFHELIEMPTGTDNLCCLQTLSGVKASTHLPGELGHLTQLKKLYVGLIGPEEARPLFAAINQIVNLYSLKIECYDEDGKYTNLVLETSLPLPEYLEKLTLGGVIMELPPWFARFNSLRVLQLVNSMLVSDPLSDLSKLPNLLSLSLFHAYTGEQMGCCPGGFPKLRHLQITSLIELEEWTPIEEGTMPCIQILRVVDCSKLRMLPQGFERLRTLESLELIEMPQEFMRRLEEEDLYKVEHIPKRTTLPRNDDTSTSNSRASSSGSGVAKGKRPRWV
ncbi:disease resistance protein RPM1-like protein [Cinnamomum micranthum f. kanehirae]|uniref:Disease resistance protein RPM1-like protein n=1 Tax=Cinnamomum micranthum f. kanehirae TaxID=337451 RepID=A0A3S3QIA8_9MAGN|nr:disease resistance protein RPM1-like protein [Cinnamomum micranthum f. kanehirae]